MGYLSQKKQQKRESIFLWVMAVIMTAFTIKYFVDTGFHIGWFNLFHVYCLSGILVIYSIWCKKYKTTFFFICLFLINYTYIAAYANIFISDKFDGKQNIILSFSPKQTLIDELKGYDIISSGSLILANKYKAPFAVIKRDIPLTVVKVDLRQVKKNEYPLIFRHLNEFVITQDSPVIIFGEFGIPAWDEDFKKFLDTSNLSVKNRLIFNNGSKFNIFSLPGFYVLGFREMGVSDISLIDTDKQKAIRIDISFNSGDDM